MSPSQRLELIRARLKQPVSSLPKPVGLFFAATGAAPLKRKKPYVRGPDRPTYSYSVYGQVIATSDNRKEWVQKADEKVVKSLRPKRVKRVSALTRISQQLPMKLPPVIACSLGPKIRNP